MGRCFRTRRMCFLALGVASAATFAAGLPFARVYGQTTHDVDWKNENSRVTNARLESLW